MSYVCKREMKSNNPRACHKTYTIVPKAIISKVVKKYFKNNLFNINNILLHWPKIIKQQLINFTLTIHNVHTTK